MGGINEQVAHVVTLGLKSVYRKRHWYQRLRNGVLTVNVESDLHYLG
jgi:hypothetical protein